MSRRWQRARSEPAAPTDGDLLAMQLGTRAYHEPLVMRGCLAACCAPRRAEPRPESTSSVVMCLEALVGVLSCLVTIARGFGGWA